MTDMIDIVAQDTQEGTQATLSQWLVTVGESINRDDPIAELETDKVTVELPAPSSGVLACILKHPGDAIHPGDILGQIDRAVDHSSKDNLRPGTISSAHISPISDHPSDANAVAPSTSNKSLRTRLSPAVRRLLKQHPLDVDALNGTGRDGRITVADIKQALAKGSTEGTHPAFQPHSVMRKRIAEHMLNSVQNAPHVTAVFEVDLHHVVNHRHQHKAHFQAQGIHLTYTAYFVAACIVAIKAVPHANSRWHDHALEVFSDINIGVGTALEDKGLIVPVIKQAQTLNLLGIAKHLQELTQKARIGKLSPSDVQDGTFTISNHGVTGSLMASPIILNQGQSAILGIGKMEKRVTVITEDQEDRIVIRPMAYISLTIDHRVLDGFQTNQFLSIVKDTLEDKNLDNQF